MPAVNEVRLLHEAGAACPGLRYADLSAETLACITRERGVDFATALLYDRVRRSEEHAPFIAAVEALEPDLTALPRLRGRVLVAPAAFYRQFPGYGGDGRLIREVAAEFGLATALAPVASTGSVSGNAAAIERTLAAQPREPENPVVLVSLSKGGADARLTLEAGGPGAGNVRVWVQIGGLVRGSPLVDAHLDGPCWRRAAIGAFLATARASPCLLPELRHGPGALLARPVNLPPGVFVINVVGFPLASHLTGGARARHRRLAALGPNDGSTLLRDAVVEPGVVYPVWGADHYFRVPEVSRLLYRLILYLARAGYLPPAHEVSHAP